MAMSPVTLGVVGGLLAVGLEAFSGVRPPAAYGICIACHGRDLIGWIVNHLAGTNIALSEVSIPFPLLTVLGVVVGAALAALRHGEFSWHWPDFGARNFAWGFLVMVFALLAAGCSIRLLIRTAHGDTLGLLAFLAMVAGIAVATAFMKWRALT
ncbi:MAG: YeeE/YedE family protein [Chloroflexota bacterium]|nr:YeeE/YedE family protein [Chloroflexota bacterium]